MQSPIWLLVTKDAINILFWFVNIAFFGVTAVLGIKTYISAKKTILQPIKTEIFKEQVKEFSKILNFFNAKKETKIREDFAIEKLYRANVLALLDEYAKTFFDYEVDIDKRPYNKQDCPSTLVTKAGMEKFFSLVDDDSKSEVAATRNDERPDPRVRAALWADYECFMLHIPKEYSEKLEELNFIKSSPLLTKESVKLIENFEKALSENREILMNTLTEVSKELPHRYPSQKALTGATHYWVSNKYNAKVQSLEEPATKIIEYIRNYYKVDEILEVK